MASATADYDEILRATGAESLRRCEGLIMLYGNDAELVADEWHYDIRRAFGLPWQRLTTAELQALEPAIQLGARGIAVLDPSWQHLLSPADVTATIAGAAFSQGAAWVKDRVCKVASQQDGVTVETISGRRIQGDFLVLATAVWTNELLRQLGHTVPLMAKRGYHSMLAQPNVAVRHPLMCISEYVVLTPMRDGLRVAGTAEFARIDAEPDYRRARVLVQHAQRFLPGLAGASVTQWMGQRPMMPDSMPVLGPLPGRERVLCAFGHGHYGLTQGPTTGRIVADLVFGQAPHVDLKPFSVMRF